MDISLTPQQKELIRQKVESGLYSTPEEVIDKALLILTKYDEKAEAFRRDVQIGLDQLERGEYTTYTSETLHELFDEISERGRQRLEARKTRQSD